MIYLDILEAIKYLILGIIQGITEVLPVSSSGHVHIAQTLFNIDMDTGLLFLILVNTGSLLTFLIIYFKRLVILIKDFFIYIFRKDLREEKHNNYIFMLRIIVACIPAGLVGLFLSDVIDNLLITYGSLLVGIGLLVTGTVLFSIRDKRILKGKTMINWTDTFLIGLAQSAAILPGISRSGLTTTMSIKRGMGIDSALNFSFLLYIPLSFASLILMIFKIGDEGLGIPGKEYYFYYLLAFIGAAVATYFAYKLIFNIFKRGKLKYFSYYCLIVGLGSIIYFMIS